MLMDPHVDEGGRWEEKFSTHRGVRRNKDHCTEVMCATCDAECRSVLLRRLQYTCELERCVVDTVRSPYRSSVAQRALLVTWLGLPLLYQRRHQLRGG